MNCHVYLFDVIQSPVPVIMTGQHCSHLNIQVIQTINARFDKKNFQSP